MAERTFNTVKAELDDIISKLESGDLQLEESLEVYAQGVKRISELQKIIDDSEIKINELVGKIDKDLSDVDNDISHA